MDNVSRRDALRGLALTVGALTTASVIPGGLFDAPDALAAGPTPTTSLTPDQAIAASPPATAASCAASSVILAGMTRVESRG